MPLTVNFQDHEQRVKGHDLIIKAEVLKAVFWGRNIFPNETENEHYASITQKSVESQYNQVVLSHIP